MALATVVGGPKATQDAELNTLSEDQPLEEEELEGMALQRMNDRLFIATTGMLSA